MQLLVEIAFCEYSNELETEGSRYAAPHAQKRILKDFQILNKKEQRKWSMRICKTILFMKGNRHTMRITERARNRQT